MDLPEELPRDNTGCRDVLEFIFSLIFVHHPFLPFSFRPSSASLPKDRSGVWIIWVWRRFKVILQQSPTWQTHQSLPASGLLYSNLSPLSFCVTSIILCLFDYWSESSTVVHKKLMLWVLPGCRDIDIASCWYILKFLCVIMAFLTFIAYWSVLLTLLWNVTQRYTAYLPLCFSWECWRALHSPDHTSKAVRTAQSHPAKFSHQTHLWLLSWKTQCLAVHFSVCILHSSLCKFLWLGNWIYVSVSRWLISGSIFNLSWPEEILDLFELSLAKWVRCFPRERNFNNLKSTHIFLIQLTLCLLPSFCCIILVAELFDFSHFCLQIHPASRAHILGWLSSSFSLDFLPAPSVSMGIPNPSRSNICY